jgi:hypothetical protein
MLRLQLRMLLQQRELLILHAPVFSHSQRPSPLRLRTR